MIIMMIYHDVFFLLKKGFGSQKEKKLSLFRRAFPTKTLHTLPRASRASPRKKRFGLFEWPQIELKEVVSQWEI